MRKLSLLVVAILALGMLSGFSALAESVNWITAEDISNMPETTIRYWYYETPERIELGKNQVAAFMKLHPNIKVEGSSAPDNTDNEMLMTYVQTQTNSNIHQSVNIEDLWYVDHGMLYPLNNFPDFNEFFARFNPALNYTHADGNVYSISWYAGPRVMFYNKAMLEKAGFTQPPVTYSEYYKFAEAVTDPANNVYAFAPEAGEEWWRWQFGGMPFYIAAKGDSKIFNDAGDAVCFNNDAMLKSLTFISELFKNKWALFEVFDINPFVSGTVASTIWGADLDKIIASNAPEGFEYVVGPVPHPDDYSGEGFNTYAFVRNFAIMDELGVPEGEERDRIRRASWEFMKFLLSDEQSAADFSVTSDLPCVKDFTSNPAFAAAVAAFGPRLNDFVSAMETATIGDTGNSLACEVHGPLQQAYLRVILNGEDPAASIAQAEQEANQIIAEGRE